MQIGFDNSAFVAILLVAFNALYIVDLPAPLEPASR
jgi:hypothetical protein